MLESSLMRSPAMTPPHIAAVAQVGATREAPLSRSNAMNPDQVARVQQVVDAQFIGASSQFSDKTS